MAQDFDIMQESALAIAQSTIQSAMNLAGITQKELSARMGRHPRFVSHMLRGDHNLTVKNFALAIAACGLQPTLGHKPITTKWTDEAPKVDPEAYRFKGGR